MPWCMRYWEHTAAEMCFILLTGICLLNMKNDYTACSMHTAHAIFLTLGISQCQFRWKLCIFAAACVGGKVDRYIAKSRRHSNQNMLICRLVRSGQLRWVMWDCTLCVLVDLSRCKWHEHLTTCL